MTNLRYDPFFFKNCMTKYDKVCIEVSIKSALKEWTTLKYCFRTRKWNQTRITSISKKWPLTFVNVSVFEANFSQQRQKCTISILTPWSPTRKPYHLRRNAFEQITLLGCDHSKKKELNPFYFRISSDWNLTRRHIEHQSEL